MSDTIPVSDIYGPVIQGEGPVAGTPTIFVRTSGCDYRCNWCDTLHCVEPERIKDDNPDDMTNQAIVESVRDQTPVPNSTQSIRATSIEMSVTFSGGNPAMHDLADANEKLQQDGYRTIVETQGTIFNDYLAAVDTLVLSPKPPSAGTHPNGDDKTPVASLEKFFDMRLDSREAPYLKIVCFNREDYEYAYFIFCSFVEEAGGFYLQAGTEEDGNWRDNYRKLEQWVTNDSWQIPVKVLPQIHTAVYGQRDGI